MFKRKEKERANNNIDTSQKNPYLAARREWDERYGDLIARAKNWRLLALLEAVALILSIGGLVSLANKSRIVPYVVEVDSLGRQVGGGFASQATLADDKLKRATLYRWIVDLRSITGDGVLQRQMIDRVYAGVAAGSPGQVQVSEFYKNDPPQTRAQSQIVTVEVASVLPSTANTYEVEWVETTRNLQGTVQGTQRWRGSLTIVVNPPTDEQLMRVNPLGIYVSEVNWSKVLK
jgi:type IV secretion system protein VirB5